MSCLSPKFYVCQCLVFSFTHLCYVIPPTLGTCLCVCCSRLNGNNNNNNSAASLLAVEVVDVTSSRGVTPSTPTHSMSAWCDTHCLSASSRRNIDMHTSTNERITNERCQLNLLCVV